MNLKEQHDELLKNKPEDVSHDEASCLFCNSAQEGGDMKTYTEDEFNAAVREAVAPFKAELDQLRTELAQDEIEAKIATAVAEAEEKVGQLQAELDKAELRASDAEKEKSDLIAFLESEARAVAEAAELETKKSARREAIKEVASFSDEYVDANIDRWVSMDEELFTAMLEDWKSVSTKEQEQASSEGDLVIETAMKNTRTENTTVDVKSVLGSVFSGSDVRKIY